MIVWALCSLQSVSAFAADPEPISAKGCSFWPCDKCNFERSVALLPDEVPKKWYDALVSNSFYRSTLMPNACNICPKAGYEPIWAAPGDVCLLFEDPPRAPLGCDNSTLVAREYDASNDFSPSHHVKA